MDEVMKLNIYNKDDRLAVTQILVKNGYKVWQGKEKKTETGKSVNYYLNVELPDDAVETN